MIRDESVRIEIPGKRTNIDDILPPCGNKHGDAATSGITNQANAGAIDATAYDLHDFVH